MEFLSRPQDGGGEVGMIHRVGEVLGLQAHGVGDVVDRAALAGAVGQVAGGIQLGAL